MTWALVKEGFDEPLLYFECSFADIEVPVEYQGSEFSLMPVLA